MNDGMPHPLDFVCPFCGAAVDERCFTARDFYTTRSHEARVRLADEEDARCRSVPENQVFT